MSLEELSYIELSKNKGFNVDTIKVGHTYEALNFDGQTYTNLGKCLRNEWNDEREPHYTNDFTPRPQYRFLTFETRDYPTKKIVKQIIDADKNAKILIFPSDIEPSAEATGADESLNKKYNGGYKHKRKTHKRKTHKRKTHKRKTHKRKTHKRKT